MRSDKMEASLTVVTGDVALTSCDNTLSRLYRLRRVKARFEAAIIAIGGEFFSGPDEVDGDYLLHGLLSLHDHEGSLIATWADEGERDGWRVILERVWECQNEYDVQHYLVGEEERRVPPIFSQRSLEVDYSIAKCCEIPF